MGQNVEGKPRFLVSPACKHLLKGLNGGYTSKEYSTSEPDKVKPLKNRYSDVQDALQYMLCGAGEMKKMYGRSKKFNAPIMAQTNFSVFN
jgi:hypothetical protein